MRRNFMCVAMLAILAAAAIGPALVPAGGEKEKKFNPLYVPTDEKVIEKMFEMAKVTKDDVVFDLGCGDGRICAMAVKKFGCRAVGIDLNPERIKECMDTIKKYKVEDAVENGKLEFRLGDALNVPDFSKATVVTLYMLPEFMNHLKPIAQKTLKPGARIVSHDFRWAEKSDWEPDYAPISFEGPSRTHTLYLWTLKGNR